MPLHKLSQKSFVNGQYDRTAQNQESVSGGGIVASGLSYAKNVLSSDKGELRKRLGTKFLKQLSGATVLIPFRMNDENDAVLAIDTNNVKGYRYSGEEFVKLVSVREGAVVEFPEPTTWTNGTQGANNITNNDWQINFSFVNSSMYPGWVINRGGRVNSYGEKYFDGYNVPHAAQAPQYISFYNATTTSCMRSVKIWFYRMSNDYYEYSTWLNPVIEYSDDGITWTGVQTDQRVDEYTNFRYFPSHTGGGMTINQVYIGRCAVTATQTNYGGEHRYWRVYFQSKSDDVNAVCVADVKFVNVGDIHDFEEDSEYTEEQLKNIKYSQEKNVMFIACEDVIPYKLLNENGELTWESFTPENTPTMWETSGGYPAAVSLFQNRLWFGGFKNNPQTVLASKFDDYETFTPNSPLQKDDRLSLRCNQLKTKIRNIVGGQKIMYCFSEDGISNIDGGSTGMIATNENIEFILKNRMPAGSSTPGFKDDVMLYSSSDGTKLYGVDYDLLVSRFQVNDLAIYAKDVTKDKITELHYVNNESKLVYGLTEAGKMFALLYEKGTYQGFFPLDFGGVVYDICPVKVGRNYKLLMVVFRDGNWYLEEKLDCGSYIDTSTPRLTSEEKKWATYDNLENNIALDCYQTYDECIDAVGTLNDTELTFNSDIELEVGKTVMLGNIGSKEWVIVNIESKIDNQNYTVSIESNRGNPTEFTKVYPEFTEFTPNLPQVADVAVISEGRYFNATKPDENAKIYLPAPCHKVIYGVPYESVAILKIQAPYESLKQVAQVDLSVIDTTHLEVGTDFGDTQNIEKIDDSSYYDLTRITMNDTYRLVLSDTPETTKNLILRSNKGVPFTVIAIDMYINYSNLGGD